jgi:3-oxoacyl-[acyl-carrier protein] reductase
MQLKQSVIAITGAANGLGKAIALDLAAQGVRLALLDVNLEGLEATASDCVDKGAEVHTWQCNVSSEELVSSTFEQIAKHFGQLNGVINNAGILRDGLLIKVRDGVIERKMSLAEWQAVIDVNLTGVFLCTREASQQMILTGSRGCIVNLSSISRAGNAGQSNYSAAKAGVAAMTVTWARELAGHGIRSMAIAPGFFATEMVASMRPEVLERMVRQIPLQSMGDPNQIAHTVRYVLENDYLTGRVIEIDGGLRL